MPPRPGRCGGLAGGCGAGHGAWQASAHTRRAMAMRIDIVTLFPEMCEGVLTTSIIGRAISAGVVEVHLTNIRDFAKDRYRKVDDAPFGGGPGMVMMCQPVFDAVEAVRSRVQQIGR